MAALLLCVKLGGLLGAGGSGSEGDTPARRTRSRGEHVWVGLSPHTAYATPFTPPLNAPLQAKQTIPLALPPWPPRVALSHKTVGIHENIYTHRSGCGARAHTHTHTHTHVRNHATQRMHARRHTHTHTRHTHTHTHTHLHAYLQCCRNNTIVHTRSTPHSVTNK